jgi:hypothetical protein
MRQKKLYEEEERESTQGFRKCSFENKVAFTKLPHFEPRICVTHSEIHLMNASKNCLEE